jgi:hypothetical protein
MQAHARPPHAHTRVRACAEIEAHEDRDLGHARRAFELPTRVRAAGHKPEASVESLRFVHERTRIEMDPPVSERAGIVDQPLKNRPTDAQSAS